MDRRALDFADELERFASTIPAKYSDPSGYEAAIAELTRRLQAVGGTFADGIHGYAIRAFGCRATSTSSPAGACRNWIVQVRRKMATPIGRHFATSIGE